MNTKLTRKKLLLVVLAALGAASMPAVQAADEQDVIKLSADVGLGYDSNAYRTHSENYVDPSAFVQPQTPIIQSGFFVPWDVRAKYASDKELGASLAASAAADGRNYLGSDLTNANEFKLIGRLGMNNLMARDGGRSEALYVGGLLGRVDNFNYDPDTGKARLVGPADDRNISNRDSYTTLGLEGNYDNELGDIRYGVMGVLEERTHDDPVVSDHYSNTYMRVGGNVEAKIMASSRLKATYLHTIRDFKERNARDLTGSRPNANGLLERSDNSYRLSLRNKIGADALVYLDYGLTTRTDNFVGYDNFTENKFGIRLDYAPGEQWRTRLALTWADVDYDNALAFNTAGQAKLTETNVDASIKTEYEFNKDQSVWVGLEHEVVNTNDLRYDYARNQFMVGSRLKF